MEETSDVYSLQLYINFSLLKCKIYICKFRLDRINYYSYFIHHFKKELLTGFLYSHILTFFLN